MLQEYLNEIFEKYKTGDASERTYYPVLENFLRKLSESTFQKTSIIIEPRRTKVGIPDFKIKTSKGLLIGYIEAKDLGADLDKVDAKQLDKYLEEYPKLILTNFIEFRLYENKAVIETVGITQPVNLKLKIPVLQNEPRLIGLLEKFLSTVIPEIYTSKRLAELLAHKTQVLKNLLVEEISLEDKEVTSTEELLEVFRKTLLHTITPEEFADMYAQTVTYGLFVARLNSGDKLFNRNTAFDFIPKTIPLLRRLFHIISGQDLPQHIAWHVDEIAEILANTKIEKIKEEFFAKGKGRDPIIHFYETFLAEYDPKEREKRGVYYTPEPVVSYIVKSINALLKEKFGKKDGFADSSVLVLDPAAGTLTFPAKAISVAKEEFTKHYGEGGWKRLIKDHILENFYAFELLMAPYAVGHLKIGLLLEELGYKLSEDDRFKLFLTNTLEMEKVKPMSMFLAPEISKESEEAYKVKEKTPILVIFGNPPYSVSSLNVIKKDSSLHKLYESYKEKVREEEKNIQPLSDDYIKFIAFAHWKINQTKQGIIGMITNNSYLDGLIHRDMRRRLLEDFSEIYVLNLHGDAKRREKAPGGSKDENVFDIRQGVTIALFVKTGGQTVKPAKVFYEDLYGLRGDIDKKETKYYYLWNNNVKTTHWQELELKEPQRFFIPKDFGVVNFYQQFISLVDIFKNFKCGIATGKDENFIGFKRENLMNYASILGILDSFSKDLKEIDYRPFDKRFILYNLKRIQRPRWDLMQHLAKGKNFALVTSKNIHEETWKEVFISEDLVDKHLIGHQSFVFPLFLYGGEEVDLDPQKQQSIFPSAQMPLKTGGKRPNMKDGFIALLNNTYNPQSVATSLEKQKAFNITPEEIFYYIYAVLYSDNYRQKYQEFLKIDFPKIPFTKDYQLFKKLAEFGKQLVDLHLLKSSELDNPVAKFYGSDSNNVEKIEYILASKPKVQSGINIPREFQKTGIIMINETQFFGGIDPEVWNYHIGGYQVLNKWLKDRKGRTLSSEDIKHYCKVVTAISKTIGIQKEIDKLYPRIEKTLL